jgi:NitT/TauT family transport system substrate-binding protein
VPGKVESVKIAHAPSTLFAPLYVAIEKGYLRDQGIDVQLDTVPAGQDAMALVAAGQLEAVVAGFGAATFAAVERGLELKVTGSMGVQPQQGYPSAFMVRKDLLQSGAVKEMKDLKGKKIAISGGNGSAGAYWVSTKLQPAGLTLSDIEIVNIGFPDQVTAFKQGAIDAAFPPAPFTTSILNDGTAEVFGGPTKPGASAVGVVYGGGFIKDRADVGRRLFTGLVRGARDVLGPDYLKDENLAIYEKYTRTPIATLKTIDRYDFFPDLHPDVDTLTDMQRVFIASNALRLSAPLPPERWADDSFSKFAVQQLGTR